MSADRIRALCHLLIRMALAEAMGDTEQVEILALGVEALC